MKFDIGEFYEKSSHFKCGYNWRTIMGTLDEDLHAFLHAEVIWMGNPHLRNSCMVNPYLGNYLPIHKGQGIPIWEIPQLRNFLVFLKGQTSNCGAHTIIGTQCVHVLIC
jgi:hypothetical protein